MAIKGSVMKVLKVKKQENFDNVYMDVLNTIKVFKPTPYQVKKCLEDLIDRLYIIRDKKNQ